MEDSVGRFYLRHNFGGFPRQTIRTNDTKKVAWSDRVLFTKDDVLRLFELNSLGSGETKKLFLTYKAQSDLPCRFHVKASDKFDIPTDELVNIEEYERKLRKESTDHASAVNFVYKSTSPGFHPVAPWLELDDGKATMHGILIQEFNGYSEDGYGPLLDVGGKFSVTVDIEDDPPESADSGLGGSEPEEDEPKIVELEFGPRPVERYDKIGDFPVTGEENVLYIDTNKGDQYYWEMDDETGEYGYVQTSDVWDGVMGVKGKFTVEISNPFSLQPTAKVVSVEGKGYTMSSLPDKRTGTDIVTVKEYDPIPDVEIQVSAIDDIRSKVVPGEEGEPATTIEIPTRKFSFSVAMKTTIKKFALDYGEDYIASGSNLYVKCTAAPGLNTQYVVQVGDFGGNLVGVQDYGYIQIPLDVNDTADLEYYEQVLDQEAAERGIPREEYEKTIDDVAHRTVEYYDWSYSAYFTLTYSPGNPIPELGENGLDWPVSLDVLPAGKEQDDDGQIFNRVYEVQTKVYADHKTMDSLPEDGNIWIDKASMMASIVAPSNVDDWKKLIYVDDDYDEAVPPRMREGIEKLVSKILFLDNDYFAVTLTQLETFLSMIRKELWAGLNASSMGEIAPLCNFAHSIRDVNFKNYANRKDAWDQSNGLFGYQRGGTTYVSCLENFNNHLLDEFKSDWKKIEPGVSDYGADSIGNRDYHHILLDGNPNFTTAASIYDYRQDILVGNHKGGKDITGLYERINQPPTTPDDIIDEIFKDGEDETWSNKVRYINAIRTNLKGDLVGMLVADDVCHLFADIGTADEPKLMWYTFDATKPTMDGFVQNKVSSDNKEFEFGPRMKFTQYPISKDGWLFKMLNRDFTTFAKSKVQDTFAIHCLDKDEGQDLWYIPQLDVFVYGASSTNGVFDLAYEQYGDRLYVLFNGDNYLYAYDNVASQRTFKGLVILKKEVAAVKLVTFNSMCLTNDSLCFDRLFLDYFKLLDSDDDEYNNWNIVLYGRNDSTAKFNKEMWCNRPGLGKDDYQQYNTIIFGDSLFDEGQLRFHNISKNKDMYDILDVNEIDGRYYGLFKNEDESTEDNITYTVFKAEKNGGVVQRLPWQILNPHMFRTNDNLYALYVVSNEPRDGETLHPVLREITVPDSDEYPERVIDIYELFKNNNGATTSKIDLEVLTLLMDEFKLKSKEGQFFALTNQGFHKVNYVDDFGQLSIDSMDDFQEALERTLGDIVLGKHMDEMHDEEQAYYFRYLKSKVNQFADDFTVFDLIPTEFKETQDVGVIPDGPVTDVDDADDHRDDSILTSTDILWTDGMVAQTDTNPGIVTAAVSNPATIYDDDTVFTKSQRNPSIEGTEFYDFINDQDGNTLMDLYAIPFIYRINSNNTYDLYINIPTTRTKYLNRIAGTLQDNGTNQVLVDDTRTRLNFLEERMANNLDESTTRLQVFIDKKYISIGTVDLVEISGNSIPTQIYRDVPNNGLYDSIALESRWNGKVEQIDEPSKDINKVMLEFECYGTDSQSIHIQGKSLVNRALNESEYGNLQENVPSTEVKQVVLTFYPNGGVVEESTRIATVGELFGELPIPTWEGHEFIGWFTGVGGEYLPDGVQVKEDSFVTSEMDTLYAHWEELPKEEE